MMTTKDLVNDRRSLVHLSPCSECPFRKRAPAGLLIITRDGRD